MVALSAKGEVERERSREGEMGKADLRMSRVQALSEEQGVRNNNG